MIPLISICYFSLSSQNLLDSLLRNDLIKFSGVINNPAKYKLQVFYTKIDRDKNNNPSFQDHKIISSEKYFYPASTVKLPVSLLALIKLEELGVKGLYKNTTVVSDSSGPCTKKITTDPSSETGLPTIENYIRRMFLVSDNAACGSVFDFVGFQYAHSKMKKMGYDRIRLFNKLDGLCSGDSVVVTPAIYFMDAEKDTVYIQLPSTDSVSFSHPIADSKVGKNEKDFSRHNYLELSDLHSMMKQLVFNNGVSERLPLSDENRLFMLKYLGMYPRESLYPKYDAKIYYDSWKKYFIYGSAASTITGDSVRVINIVGRAYGFLIDCAYIVDLKNNVEFLLTAGIYVNERNTFGSGKYEYDKIGLPFLKALSLSIYNFERKRKKRYNADLSEIRDLFK